MKQFLYLDNDIVASIIAQSEKGLITQMVSEQGEGNESEEHEAITGNVNTNVSGGLLKLFQAGAALGAEAQTGSSQRNQSSTKEMVEKTLHDAAFDVAYKYISPKKANSKEDDAGDYIEIKTVFTIVDFNYFDKLFEKNGAIDIIKKTQAQKIEDEMRGAKGENSRDQLRKVNVEFKKKLRELVSISNQQFDDAATLIRLIKGIVPYNRMLISSDGYLIPFDDKYFRIDPANLGFKYGGEITCVGLITNIIGKSEDPGDEKDLFSTIQFSANEVLRSILPTKDEDLCVVHPIAVYYENKYL